MNAYFVLGIITAVWAVGLTAYGLTRENFPSSNQGTRAVIGVTVLLVLGTLVALMATTHKEHPREEAAEEAAKAAEEQEEAPEGEKGEAGGGGGKISADENEYTIDIDGGNTLDGAGKYTFEIDNSGRIDHDFAVQGDGVDEKTDLIEPGGQDSLAVDLAPGDYRVYCTVPDHAEQGMQVDLTVQ